MKLHLPFALRAALLAVLSTAWYAQADLSLTIDDELQTEWDGVIAKNTVYEKDITIQISGDSHAEFQSESYVGTGHEVNITLNGGSLDMNTAYVGKNGTTRITVDGGVVHSTGATYVGHATQASTQVISYIEVKNGGQYFVDNGEYARGQYGGLPEVHITVGDKGLFSVKSAYIGYDGEAYITVEQGGQFLMRGSSVGSGGNANIALRANSDIVVRGEMVLTDFSMISNNDAFDTVVTSTIRITDGGHFVIEGNGARLGAAMGGNTILNVTVDKGGLVEHQTGYMGSVEVKDKNVTPVTSVTTVTVGDGGTYVLSGGTIGYSGTATIDILQGGVFTQTGGGGLAVKGANLTLNVKSGGVFNKSGSVIINNSAEDSATITVDAGGVVNMDGGTINAAAEITMNGTWNLAGSAKFSLANVTGNGEFFVHDKATLDLAGMQQADDLTVHMCGGNLANASQYQRQMDIAVGKKSTAESMNMGGLNAQYISSLVTQKAVSLTNLAAGSTLTIHKGDSMTIGSAHVWDGRSVDKPDTAAAMIQFAGGDGHIVFADDAALMLHFGADVLDLTPDDDGNIWVSVWFANVDLGALSDEELRKYFRTGSGWGASFDGFVEQDNGVLMTLKLINADGNIWRGSDYGGDMNHDEVTDMGSYGKVLVDRDSSLTLDDDDDVTLRQLEGWGRETDLTVEGGTGDSTLHLENQDELGQEGTGDTVFEGNIHVTGSGVTVDKTGNADFTIEGDFTTEGDLRVSEGSFTVGEDSTSKVDGKIAGLGDEDEGTTGNLVVEGHLSVQGPSDLTDSHGSITGDGTLHTQGDLIIGEDVELNGPTIDVAGGATLDVTQAQDAKVGGLEGEGSLQGDLTITGAGDSNFSGSFVGSGSITVADGGKQEFSGSGSADYELNVQQGGNLTLTGMENDQAAYGSVSNSGNLTLSAASDASDAQGGANILVHDDIVFYTDTTTTFRFNLNADAVLADKDATMLETARTIYIEDDAVFRLDLKGTKLNNPDGDYTNIVVLRAAEILLVEKYEELGLQAITLDLDDEPVEKNYKVELLPTSYLSLYFESGDLEVVKGDDGDTMVMNLVRRQGSVYDAVGDSYNTRAARGMLEALTVDQMGADDALRSFGDALAAAMVADPAKAKRMMAALAGSTTTSLGAAQLAAMREQMGRMRWHAAQRVGGSATPTLGHGDDSYRVITAKSGQEVTAPAAMPAWVHAWVEGTGSYTKLKTRGDESGYSLNSWGGSAGVDMDMSDDLRIGVALTALYGDLEARAAERSRGDLDHCYVSLYSHYQSGDWGHTLLLAGGLSEGKLTRTVDYGEGAYRAQGKTDGYSWGALYELTYDVALDDDKTSVLQPLANVMVANTRMDGYAESGAGGAGLSVGKQEMTSTVLGLGLRWLQQGGAGVFGREARLELRANVAQELGDHRGSADVALLANPSVRVNVRGAQVGRTALQLGAGLSLPLDDDVQVYMNANADFRRGEVAWDGSIGLRVSF